MIQNKALLAQLSISQWTARKQDKSVTAEVEQRHGAHDSGKFNKLLVNKELLDPISKLVSKARDIHYNLTLPWSDAGPRLLPSALFTKYTDTFRDLRSEFENAVNTAVQAYPSEVQAARNRLGTMYQPGDYPGQSELYEKFAIKVDFTPVPNGDDFRLSIDKDAQDELKRSVTYAVHDRQEQAVKATYSRIEDVVSKIEERLSQPEAIFKDSLILNAIELCTVLDGLNITDDPKITSLCQEIKDKLTMPPSVLRSRPDVRKTTAEHAREIKLRIQSCGQ